MKKYIKEVMVQKKADRRVLPNVLSGAGMRSNKDRRHITAGKYHFKDIDSLGDRYILKCEVNTRIYHDNTYKITKLRSRDISATGMLLECRGGPVYGLIRKADYLFLEFTPEPGTMPEGFEHRIKIKASIAREVYGVGFGVKFTEPLTRNLNKNHGVWMNTLSVVMLSTVFTIIMLMRTTSVLYFRFNNVLYLYSILTAIYLLSRFFFAALTRPDPVNPKFTPGVSIVIPCFNEEEWIDRTIISCMNQAYPTDKLEVIVVDDCSNDNSAEVIKQAMRLIKSGLDTSGRLSLIVQKKNAGKREALIAGTLASKNDLVVFVDSDSFLEPTAIMNLVQPFQDPKIGGVAGRTNVANAYTNWLTKMQATRYYIAFRILKSAESFFDAVTCLSGPLACYRKEIVLDNKDDWLNQKFFGLKATFGDDRALTNIVLRKYRTRYQDSAICSTIVPSNQSKFLKQQMRWKRSWLRESINALRYIWKKEPLALLFFLMGLFIPVLAPVIVAYNLIYTPITGRLPVTFLFGLAVMSMFISFAYLFLKKSRLWATSFLFCIYYELILLWQMPIAWITFWKSTWGTRMTPEDVRDMEKNSISRIFRKSGARYKRTA